MELIRAADLDTSPPTYVVKGMLPDLGCGFGYGDSYTGKSLTLGVELCLAIANGVPYFGHETVQGSAVWGLGEGLPDAGVRIKARLIRENADREARAAWIEMAEGKDAADAWLAAQPPYTDDRMFIRKSAFQVPFNSLNQPSEELRQAARELGLIRDLRLVVLDTARRHTSLSLSNGTSSNRFMLGLGWLAAQLQCTVMAIGHPVSKGRGETGLPGDTLFGASDFVWRIKAGPDSTDAAPNAVILAEKVKSGPLFPPIAYELEPIQWRQQPTDPETGREITGVAPVLVQSVTVRQREDEQAPADDSDLEPAITRSRPPLPQAEPVPSSRPRRRTGIRPQASLWDAPGQAAKDDMTTTLLSVPCPACPAPVGTGCQQTEDPDDRIMLSDKPLITVHLPRIETVIDAGVTTTDAVLAAFPVIADPEPATAPI
jgi:hypothetical protein